MKKRRRELSCATQLRLVQRSAKMADLSQIPLSLENVKEVAARAASASRRLLANGDRGLKKAGVFLQRESQKIVPVQLGNLKNSAFTRSVEPGHVVVGYTANYAVYVHENLEAAHGLDFNLKHADKINSRSRAVYHKDGRISVRYGTAKSGWFPRNEKQQAKFLERPMREKMQEILWLIAESMKQTK